MIFVNFKTYSQATGEKAVFLAKICEKVSKETKIKIIPVVQVVDLFRVSQAVKIPVWVQHLDWYPQGQFTGFTNLEAVFEAGGRGTILNHAEHKLPLGTLKRTVKRIKNFNQENNYRFETLICCRSLGQAKNYVKIKPDFLAYEPSELIGGEISVSQFNPTAIYHFKEICGEIPAIIGAGIKNSQDIKIGLKLGVKGILVSSHVVLAGNPEKVLKELTEGFK
ncbi:MAG: triose-phosphate isomerase [Microgenomates group bacterium]